MRNRLRRILLKAMKWTFIVFCLFLVSLFFREQRLSPSWVSSIVCSCMPSNMVFQCEGVSFGFRNGFRLEDVRVYDTDREDKFLPVVSAESVVVDLMPRVIKIVALKVPRLHDEYYKPGNFERNERIDAELPTISPISLVLVRPYILGVAPERVRAVIRSNSKRLDVSDIHIDWPDIDRKMSLDGYTYVDLHDQRVCGEVRGETKQSHIRPLIEVLDLPVVLPYMDAFTGVIEPVTASCAWDVNLVNSDLKLHLDLHPILGRYNDIPMRRVDGVVDVYSYTRGTNLNYVTTVGPLVATDPQGRILEGQLTVRGTNGIVNVYFDAKSTLEKAGLLSIVDYLDDGELECVRCDTPPEITVNGTLATDVARQAENDILGTVMFKKGMLFDMPVDDVSLNYSYKGDTVNFTNVRAKGRDGGLFTGGASLHLPGLDPERATFELAFDCRDGSVAEIADILATDLDGRQGVVNASIVVAGPISTNVYPKLCGHGKLRVDHERLLQMKLFMGLTDYLAKNVPGVAGLVNQSRVTADFTIVNGVITSKNVFIEGDVFTIMAWGSYDIVADNLDFTVRLQLLRNDSFLAKLVRPVTFPFTKLLLEFKVTGSRENPKWQYITVLDRIL